MAHKSIDNPKRDQEIKFDMKTPIVIEPATSFHGEKIPDLIFSTAPSVYGHSFLNDRSLFDRFMLASWTAPASSYGYRETTIARDTDDLLGIEIGYGGERYYELHENGSPVGRTLIENGSATVEQMKAVGRASYDTNFQIPYVPADAYYVMSLAVTEASRGKGIGAMLLNNALEEAQKAGYRTLHLDVLADNPAVEFYKRLGLTCMVESVSPQLREFDLPVEYRMVKRLR